MNAIPGINAVSGMHDVFQVRLDQFGGSFARNVLNVPGMPLAAGLTYGALADTFVDVPVYSVFQLEELQR